MNLHENNVAFGDAIRVASDYLRIKDIFIEKDYWVTFILKRLSLSSYKDDVVFKGGTSLSKVYNLIDRFSEDVDLAIIKSEGRSETQERIMIRKVEKELTFGFREIEVPGLTSKQKNFRKTVYIYDKITDKPTTGIHDKLILEINSFANPVPFNEYSVGSLIAKYLRENGNEDAIKKYQLEPFKILVLDSEVTLIEKILSLIRLSFFDNGVDRIREKVRHFYDIYFLTSGPEFSDPDYIRIFKNDLNEMFEEEKNRFHDPENWIKSHYTESPLFKEFDEIWRQVKGSYETDFKLLVQGKFPNSDQVSEQMKKLIENLK